MLFAGRLAGVRGGGCAPAGALGQGRWGAFSESAKEGAAGSEIQPYLGGAGAGDPACRSTAQVAAAFRGRLGILRGWECGLLDGASS